MFEKIKAKQKKEVKWLLKPHFKAFGLQRAPDDNGTVVNYVRVLPYDFNNSPSLIEL